MLSPPLSPSLGWRPLPCYRAAPLHVHAPATCWPGRRPPAHPGSRLASVAAAQAVPGCSSEVDVVVVGSGIIGLLVTRQLLLSSPLSLALFDAQQPCAGATGAGQGYIWMAHRDPTSPTWALAAHSKALWQQMAAAPSPQHPPPQQQQQHPHLSTSPALREALEWQPTGSLLLATTDEEVRQLAARAQLLAGVGGVGHVVLLSPRELAMREPALMVPPGSRGLLVEDDAQINGKRAAFALLEDCQRLGAAAGSSSSSSRLMVGLQEGVQQLVPLGDGDGVDVVTSTRRVRARRGVVVCAGVWSGRLLAGASGQASWQQLLQPRRGHLLEMSCPEGMPPLNTGMMELSYTQHYSNTHASGPDLASHNTHGSSTQGSSSSSSHAPEASAPVDITFTATSSASGTLLIGSSREFSGWESVPSSSIIDAILDRARLFLPALKGVTSSDVLSSTRVGLRPYALGGLPAIGPVPGLPGVYVAAGHEGSGLCLGPATAELVVHYLLGDDRGSGVSQEVLQAAQDLFPERRLAACSRA